MDYVGWIIGLVGIALALWFDHRSNEERQRLHSFLKALKPGIAAGEIDGVIGAINDEMAMLIKPAS